MVDEIARLDAVGQAQLVARGELTPSDLVAAAISRIERLDPRIGAVILPAFERARRQAAGQTEALAAARRNGLPPFWGVPFLMKDIGGQEAGAPCHMGMRLLKRVSWTEPADSHLTRKLRAAGFVLLGRTNTPELALLPTTEPLAYGPTHNPWSREHSAGGSSGGAAAAVAAGMVPAAHASDGGGSIRIPAAHCGIVGLKPTRGRSSFGPGSGERWAGFSVEHVVTRTVRDAAAILDVTAGPMPGDPYFAPPPARSFAAEVGAPVERLRIGMLQSSPRDGVRLHPECLTAVQRAARLLQEIGHTVEESHPQALGDGTAVRAYVTVVSCSVARALEAAAEKVGEPIGPDDVEPLTAALAEMGRAASAAQYIAAIETVHRLGRGLAEWWENGFDLLLSPTTAEPPPRLGELACPPEAPLQGFIRAAPFGVFTSAFNQSGQPAISLPLHWTASGLPVGVQLVAAYGREDLLLRVAAQLEAACPWRDRWPDIAEVTSDK
jgi:amidase